MCSSDLRTSVPAVHRRTPVVPDRATAFDRERHPADYSILVAVAALAAIGILMVYSSSAMKALLQHDNAMAVVGPQILWAGLGLLVMLVVMRIDYRYLRLVSVPGYLLAIALLCLVFVPQFNRVVGGSAR